MADHRRQFDENPRRHEREWTDRPREDRHSWFDDRSSRYESDRASDDRGSRWEGASDERASGMYRTDDRPYHDRYRDGQRDDYLRWSAQNMGVWGDQTPSGEAEHMPSWLRRERGGYWRPVRVQPATLRGPRTEGIHAFGRSHPRGDLRSHDR